jgi:hypothetical protein
MFSKNVSKIIYYILCNCQLSKIVALGAHKHECTCNTGTFVANVQVVEGMKKGTGKGIGKNLRYFNIKKG